MKQYPFQYIDNYDGDTVTGTITIALDHPCPNEELILKKTLTIRILGIDTPEIKSKVKEEKDAAKIVKFEVTKFLRKYQDIHLLTDWNCDKYGRLLANFISLQSQINLSDYLINNGLAIAYQGGTKPPFDLEFLAKINQCH
jgi:endonuclease YncB( thermonuclease family)